MDQAARAGRPGGGSAARPTAAKSGRTAWGSVPRRGAGYGGQVPHQARLESSVTCQCQTPRLSAPRRPSVRRPRRTFVRLDCSACWEFSPRTTSISRLTVRFLHGSPLKRGRRRCVIFVREPSSGRRTIGLDAHRRAPRSLDDCDDHGRWRPVVPRGAKLKIWCPQGRGGSIPPPGTSTWRIPPPPDSRWYHSRCHSAPRRASPPRLAGVSARGGCIPGSWRASCGRRSCSKKLGHCVGKKS